MKENKTKQILLNELSQNGDWTEIMSEAFEDNHLSDLLLPESDTTNLKTLALDIKNKLNGTFTNG